MPCFAESNVELLYKDYEQLVDNYNWPLSEIKQLNRRERTHWVKRVLYELEQKYQRMHQQNNAPQVVTGSTGQGVTFNGKPFRYNGR